MSCVKYKAVWLNLALCLFALAYFPGVVEGKKRMNPTEGFEMTFLHNNDMHARFEEIGKLGGSCKHREKETTGCYGGFARTAHLIETFRKEAVKNKDKAVIYLNAGDTYQGTPWFNIHKWKIVTDLLNRLRPDAASLGNHEFDDGVSGLVPYLKGSTYPILAANLNISDEPTMQNISVFKRSQVFHVKCHKIGVIGYLTPETKTLSAKQNNITFEREVDAIKSEIKRLKRQNVRIFVALGHSGYNADRKIADSIPSLDLVVGGHSNTFLWNGKQPDVETVQDVYPVQINHTVQKRTVYVVQAYAHTKYLGVLNMTFDARGQVRRAIGQPILVNETKEEQCSMLNSVEIYRDKVEAETLEIVGKCTMVMPVLGCRSSECALGGLITNAFLNAYDGDSEQYGPAVLMNGGGIRAPLDASNNGQVVTHEMLLSIAPFGTMLMTGIYKGSVIKEALEHSVKRYQENNAFGEYAHMTNMKVTYDMSKPPGKRATDIQIMCTKCEPKEYVAMNMTDEYKLLSTAYLINGGDGYKMLKENGNTKTNLGIVDLAALKSYVKMVSPITKDAVEELLDKTNMINFHPKKQ